MAVCGFGCSLKRDKTGRILEDYGMRARKRRGERVQLEEFARFLDAPESDLIRDMFALFDEVRKELGRTPSHVHTHTDINHHQDSRTFIERWDSQDLGMEF